MTPCTVHELPPTDPRARALMHELDQALLGITGDSGAAGFDAAGGALFLVARDADGLEQGCGALRPLGDGVAELKRMYARPGTRGVGAALLARLEHEAAARGWRALWLETRRVNARALAFYRRHGYAEIESFGAYAGRPEAVCLGKPLGLRRVAAAETALLAPLTSLFLEVIAHGNSLGFLAGAGRAQIEAYWRGVLGRLDGGLRLWVLQDGDRVLGTVQLDRCTKPNGRHRAEVQKLMVEHAARGHGVARRLLEALEQDARTDGCSLLVLDTETGSPAEQVYRRLGWTRAGEIPGFAADTAGRLQPTSLYYKPLPA